MLAARRFALGGVPGRATRFYSASASDQPLFDKVLVANRGEIACRVFKTCRKLGINTVAVYSEPDARAVHVRMADEAVCVGPAASTESYLDQDKIVSAAKSTGASAIHPGYGFLSENADFSRRLDAEGIEFVGPNGDAIHAMGDKIESMRLAQEAGVSTAPRFDGEVHDVEHAIEIAKEIEYPIIMKASAGGGGKGMRVAWNEEELIEGFKLARDEAMASFGDNRMLIQHFVCPVDGRHIEIQLVGDKHGNVLTLPERECSIQRRNQKVVEEAPSVLLTPDTRKAMQEQAAQLARAAGYHSAGTVEFLCDNDQNFYFLEMNTRLQVEHPVTELVTGIDLVELMLRVSAGQPIPAELLAVDWSDPASMKGWAIESRVYAEDPTKDFLPSVGLLTKYVEPSVTLDSEHVRCDSGVDDGSEISMYYDPMICKLCTHGDDREMAINRMVEALDSYVIEGLNHNIPLLYDIVDSDVFRSGDLTTNFIKNQYPDGFMPKLSSSSSQELASIAALVHQVNRARKVGFASEAGGLPGYKNPAEFSVSIETGDIKHQVDASVGSSGELSVSVDGSPSVLVSSDYVASQPIIRATIDDKPVIAQFMNETVTGYTFQFHGAVWKVDVLSELQKVAMGHMPVPPELDLSKLVVAPISGTIRSIAVSIGDEVAPGQEIAVLEAMKMHNSLKAGGAGVVKAVHFSINDVVSADDFIVELE